MESQWGSFLGNVKLIHFGHIFIATILFSLILPRQVFIAKRRNTVHEETRQVQILFIFTHCFNDTHPETLPKFRWCVWAAGYKLQSVVCVVVHI